ncbi:MAG: hypothetical protein WDO24_01585 [Pseudomonadota bacterium]
MVREILRRRQVPVIFVTGYVHQLVSERQLHHSLVIGKPFASQTLEAAVRRITVNQMHRAGRPVANVTNPRR